MVKEEKLQQVEQTKKLLEQYPVIGIIDMHKLPSKQLQEIKKQLRGKALITVTKKSILLHAIKNVGKKELTELEKYIPLQPGVVFTSEEPFKFYMSVSKLKSPTFAKGGDIAGDDIVVSAGPTNLMPGPVISELNKVGIVAGVEEGKIAIKKDKVVVKKGETISKELASVLRKLNIEASKVGLNIVSLFDNGMIYTKDVLSLVGDNYINKMREAFNQALNLSVSICYPTKNNIGCLLIKAVNAAKMIESKIGGVN